MSSGKVLAGTIACCALSALAGVAFADEAPQRLTVTAADRAAVSSVKHSFKSVFSKGTSVLGTGKLRSDSATLGQHGGNEGNGGGGNTNQYPGDLGYLGGATIHSTVQHPIYLIPNQGSNCSAAQPTTCWGDVSQFIRDLETSPLMHVTDQYVGAEGGHRYPLGTVFEALYTPPANPLIDADMQALAHAAALSVGGGYGHVFHIFLVPGQVECFDATFTVCSSNVFCAYHGSAVFPDVGEVVYSVEPNVVNVFGCNPPANSPNGGFDATYGVLSHETIELITDPDGTAWFNITNSGLLGAEIGDECLFWLFDSQGNFISTNPVVQVFHGRPYAIQTEYNNAAHACTTHAAEDN